MPFAGLCLHFLAQKFQSGAVKGSITNQDFFELHHHVTDTGASSLFQLFI